jgi:hypothetical protein
LKDPFNTRLLDEANDLIHNERAEAYGSALENATAWAQMFSAATGLDVRPEHYPVAHICTKLVRERHKHKRDNWVDIAGYAGVRGKMLEEEAGVGGVMNELPIKHHVPVPPGFDPRGG